jgi:NADH-quinone oxidoreductase subunit M
MFGKIENPKNERLLDLNNREFATFAPLLILAVWMGLYPARFLDRLKKSVQHIMMRVDPQYAQAYAACGTPVTAEQRAAATTPGGQFLASVPCDANGNPLPQSR